MVRLKESTSKSDFLNLKEFQLLKVHLKDSLLFKLFPVRFISIPYGSIKSNETGALLTLDDKGRFLIVRLKE